MEAHSHPEACIREGRQSFLLWIDGFSQLGLNHNNKCLRHVVCYSTSERKSVLWVNSTFRGDCSPRKWSHSTLKACESSEAFLHKEQCTGYCSAFGVDWCSTTRSSYPFFLQQKPEIDISNVHNILFLVSLQKYPQPINSRGILHDIYLYLNEPEFIQKSQILKTQESSIRLLCVTDHTPWKQRDFLHLGRPSFGSILSKKSVGIV